LKSQLGMIFRMELSKGEKGEFCFYLYLRANDSIVIVAGRSLALVLHPYPRDFTGSFLEALASKRTTSNQLHTQKVI
jgi:hypothetical protein